jgi:hypothetical protein
MRAAIGAFAASAALLAAVSTPQATAHEDPPGCTTSGPTISFDPSSDLGVIHRNGDHLDIAMRARNDTPDVCSITDATVTVTVPAPDGTPGSTTTVASGINLLAGTAQFTLPTTVPHDVNFNASTFSGTVTASISGTQHFGEPDSTGSIGSVGTPLVTSKPQASLSVAPVMSSGSVPFDATYNYTVTNKSPENTAPGQPEPALFNGDNGICPVRRHVLSPHVHRHRYEPQRSAASRTRRDLDVQLHAHLQQSRHVRQSGERGWRQRPGRAPLA